MAYLAIMAANPAHYHYFPESGGDVTISDLAPYMNGSQLEEGVYVTPVGFDLSGGAANGLIGSNVTFITRGEIDFSGSNIQLNPYFSGLLFLTDGFVTGGPCDNNSVIKFSGSNSSIGGIWFAPNGQIGVTSSSDMSLTGSLIAGQVDVSGSNLYLEAFEPGKPDENDYSNNTAEAIFTLIIPYPTADPGGPYLVNEGSTIQLDASASSGLNLSAYDWDLDNDGLYDDASGITVTFDNTADNAIYPIGLQVSNSYGLTDTAATTLTVNNVAPSLTNLSTNTPITESQAITLTGAIIDPGSQDTFTITVDWADGQQDTLPYPANTIAFTITHQYLDNPPGPSETYTISLDIEDKDGGSDSAELPIQVHNSPPTVNAGPDQEVLVNIPIQVSGTFTDLSPLDTHTITWNFGDGTTITGSLTTTHTYETAGNYTVTLTIIDDNGGLGSDSLAILVSNHSIFIPAAIHQPVSTTTVSTNSADLPKTGAPGPMFPNNNKRPIHVMLKPEIPTL